MALQVNLEKRFQWRGSPLDRFIDRRAVTRLSREQQRIADRIMPSALTLTTVIETNKLKGGTEKEVITGSAFVVAASENEVLLVTNRHVVEDSLKNPHSTLTATTSGWKGSQQHEEAKRELTHTEVVHVSEQHDLAFVKVTFDRDKELNGEKLPPIKLGDSSHLQAGEMIFGAGAPYAVQDSFYQAMITHEVPVSKIYGQCIDNRTCDNYIAVSSAHPGNSGGMYVNVYGQVVGVTTAGFDSTAGLMIPINTVKAELAIYQEKAAGNKLPSNRGIVTRRPAPHFSTSAPKSA